MHIAASRIKFIEIGTQNSIDWPNDYHNWNASAALPPGLSKHNFSLSLYSHWLAVETCQCTVMQFAVGFHSMPLNRATLTFFGVCFVTTATHYADVYNWMVKSNDIKCHIVFIIIDILVNAHRIPSNANKCKGHTRIDPEKIRPEQQIKRIAAYFFFIAICIVK